MLHGSALHCVLQLDIFDCRIWFLKIVLIKKFKCCASPKVQIQRNGCFRLKNLLKTEDTSQCCSQECSSKSRPDKIELSITKFRLKITKCQLRAIDITNYYFFVICLELEITVLIVL